MTTARAKVESWLSESKITKKIQDLPSILEILIKPSDYKSILFKPVSPFRPHLTPLKDHPTVHFGLGKLEGHARLLSDLANIELQAIEIGIITLLQFPDAEQSYRFQLTEVCLEESIHLNLCLNAMQDLRYNFGDFSLNLNLWNTAVQDVELLPRIITSYLYLEASGLDAGENIQRKLTGCPIKESPIFSVTQRIAKDEIKHVRFGRNWYLSEALRLKADASTIWKNKIQELKILAPKNFPISTERRRLTGMTDEEIDFYKL